MAASVALPLSFVLPLPLPLVNSLLAILLLFVVELLLALPFKPFVSATVFCTVFSYSASIDARDVRLAATAFSYDDSVVFSVDFPFVNVLVSIPSISTSSLPDDDKDCGCCLGDDGALVDDVALYTQFSILRVFFCSFYVRVFSEYLVFFFWFVCGCTCFVFVYDVRFLFTPVCIFGFREIFLVFGLSNIYFIFFFVLVCTHKKMKRNEKKNTRIN